jgi:hypothetical protein
MMRWLVGLAWALSILGFTLGYLDRFAAQKEATGGASSSPIPEGTAPLSGRDRYIPEDTCAKQYDICCGRCRRMKTRDEQADCFHACAVAATECISGKREP